MADFPTSVYVPRTKQNRLGVVYDPTKTRVGYAEDVTKLDAEVVSIETILGLNPQGASASVGARISALDVILNKANLGAGYLMRWDGSKFVNSNIFQDANGNEGIGTTGPTALLQLTKSEGVYATTAILNIIPEANYGIKLQQYHTGSVYDYYLMQNNGSATDVNLLTFKSGNVGIGTTSPLQKLSVAGNISLRAGDIIRQVDSAAFERTIFGTSVVTPPSGQNFSFIQSPDNDYNDGVAIRDYAGTQLVTILNGGNVGIGTTEPSAKADINSDILRLRTAKTLSLIHI